MELIIILVLGTQEPEILPKFCWFFFKKVKLVLMLPLAIVRAKEKLFRRVFTATKSYELSHVSSPHRYTKRMLK